jgi:hypothetical protein
VVQLGVRDVHREVPSVPVAGDERRLVADVGEDGPFTLVQVVGPTDLGQSRPRLRVDRRRDGRVEVERAL